MPHRGRRARRRDHPTVLRAGHGRGALGPAIVAQTSDEDDLLVVGAPARRWWSASPFALVRYCLRLTSCPVVVVPAPALVREHGLRASARAIQREAQRYLETSGRSS